MNIHEREIDKLSNLGMGWELGHTQLFEDNERFKNSKKAFVEASLTSFCIRLHSKSRRDSRSTFSTNICFTEI